jgi:hypothetical protein
MHYQNKKNGYAMIFTVLIISIVLSVSLGLANTFFKQQTITSLARDSQTAFYMADSGLECMLWYYYTLTEETEEVVKNTPVNCVLGNPVNDPYGAGDVTVSTPVFTTEEEGLQYTFSPEGYEDNQSACFILGLIFDEDPNTGGLYIKRLESNGYNICAPGSIRRVERTLFAEFLPLEEE